MTERKVYIVLGSGKGMKASDAIERLKSSRRDYLIADIPKFGGVLVV